MSFLYPSRFLVSSCAPPMYDLQPIVQSFVALRGCDPLNPKLTLYANTEGVIMDAPQHPNTWYNIKTVVRWSRSEV
jgi:hypothetical protein